MRTSLAILLAGAAVALPACGGDDETTTTTTSTTTGASGASGTSDVRPDGGEASDAGETAGASDEKAVTQAVQQVVGGGDPEVACATAATEGYVKSSYGDEQGCRAAVEGQGTFEVEVEDITVDGQNAEATAVPAGGPNEGEELTVRLVDEDGTWKVDFLRSDAPAGP